MENQVWQPLPGVDGVKIFPFLRKVDIISSNSYLVEAPELLVLVDPGGIPEQADVLLKEIRRLIEEKPRPLLVCLTHVHLDHCHQLLHHPGFQDIPRRLVAVHEQGARALEEGDRAATIADLIQQDLKRTTIDLPLLEKEPGGVGRPEVARGAGAPCITCLDPLETQEGISIPRQVFPLSGDSVIEFFHTPGHSPDSICIRMGEVLFIGDLVFATAPGVAGLKGWDPGALLSSIDRVCALLSRGGISVCLPGHGRPMDTASMLRILAGMKKETGKLDGIETINPEWVKETAAYAGDLMDEVDRLFTIMAGRLVYVAHVLDELEESGEADRMRGMIDSDLVDELLADFNRFSIDYHSGQVLEIHLALKANQISQKLERVYHGEALGSVLDLSLVRRVGRLLEDYTITFRGFRPRVELVPTDLSIAAGELVSAISSPGYRDESIIDAESDEEFARALALRIAYVNPFEELDLGYSPGRDLPLARLDRERFADTLLYILEKVSVAGVTKISLATGSGNETVWIGLSFDGSLLVFSGKARKFMARCCRLSGGICTMEENAGRVDVRLEYPAVIE